MLYAIRIVPVIATFFVAFYVSSSLKRLVPVLKWDNTTIAHFQVFHKGEKNRSKEDKLNMPGIDFFRMEGGKICEVWTFAKNQAVEDEY